jgi:hypothetical protein
MLSPDCLLRIAIGEHARDFDDSEIDFTVVRTESADSLERGLDQPTGVILAVDDKKRCILIRGVPLVVGQANHALIAELLTNFKADRNADRAPENYRFTAARMLASRLSIEEQTLRRRVSRFRRVVARSWERHVGHPLRNDAIIESKGWQGYRLNPAIRLVAAKEFKV